MGYDSQTYNTDEQQLYNSKLVVMSLYNGFVNHDQQSKYYTLVQYLVLALQKRLVKFYNNQQVNEVKFVKILFNINRKIAKMEQSKYQEPKFGNILNTLMERIYPQYAQQNARKSNFSNVSSAFNVFNANNSRISFDFSVDQLPKMENHRPPSLDYQQGSSIYHTHPVKYRSLETIKKNIHANQQAKQQSNNQNLSQKSLKSKINQFKSLRLRLHPPKIGEYIQKIKEQSNTMFNKEIRSDHLKTVNEFEPYIGQRRKKTRKVYRTVGVQK